MRVYHAIRLAYLKVRDALCAQALQERVVVRVAREVGLVPRDRVVHREDEVEQRRARVVVALREDARAVGHGELHGRERLAQRLVERPSHGVAGGRVVVVAGLHHRCVRLPSQLMMMIWR